VSGNKLSAKRGQHKHDTRRQHVGDQSKLFRPRPLSIGSISLGPRLAIAPYALVCVVLSGLAASTPTVSGALVIVLLMAPQGLLAAQAIAVGLAYAEPFGTAASFLGVAAFVPALLKMLPANRRHFFRDFLKVTWPALILLCWLTVVSMLHGYNQPLPALALCAAALLAGVAWTWTAPRVLVQMLGAAGWTLLLINLSLLAASSPDTARFAGTAGSSNALMLSIFALAPFAVAMGGTKRPLLRPLLLLAFPLLCFPLLGASGSAQGVVYCAIFISASTAWLVKSPKAKVLGVVGALIALAYMLRETAVVTKLLTESSGNFSGRADIWSASLTVIADGFPFGTGRRIFLDEFGTIAKFGRGAHNAHLSLILWGGIIALGLWVATWVRVIRRSASLGFPVSVALLVILAGSLVGGLETLTITWLILGAALGQVGVSMRGWRGQEIRNQTIFPRGGHVATFERRT